MPLNSYVTLGRSGSRVSPFCLGAMTFGEDNGWGSSAAERVAAQLDTDVPSVALAWVQSKPGVTSTIIGARTLGHLEGNLKALDLELTPAHIGMFDAVSKPTLNIPADFNANLSPNFAHAGATVNGVEYVVAECADRGHKTVVSKRGLHCGKAAAQG